MSEAVMASSASSSAQPPVIELVDAMPGLPAMAKCVLVQLDETGALYRLQSVLDPDLRLQAPLIPAA
jgi:hypothetical protein